MRRAIALALENVSSGRGGPFGAVIVKNGDVISEAVNTVTSDNDPTAHAEVNAIRAACRKLGTFQLDGCDIYTSCEPCPMCLGAIYWSRPRAIYFGAGNDTAAQAGFDDSEIYRQVRSPFSARSIPMQELLPGEAAAPFTAWINFADRIRY